MASEQPPDNIYDRCAYMNCYNGKNSTGHKLFRFPAYNDSRHNLWIRYAGNVRLRTWSSATIRRAGICADHFGRESFTDETRQSLRRHAVPKPYSATDAQAKASTTLLDYIRTLPRKRTRNQRLLEAEESQRESAASQDSSDLEDASFAAEKPMPVQAHIVEAVKTLRKVKMIKIEDQIDDSNRTVILERCKNPETCPAKHKSTSRSEKARPHFHKIYISNSEAAKLDVSLFNSMRQTKHADARSSKNVILETQSIDEGSEEPCHDVKSSDNVAYQLEKYLINVKKNVQKRNPTTAARYNDMDSRRRVEITKSIAGGKNIHTEKEEPAMITVPDYISKKHPSTTELVKEYYRTKDERVFDRCAYLNCKNGRYTTGARLFRFPQFTDPRLNTWIKNAGNPRMLYWSPATIRRAGLCGEHFTDESFFNSTRQRLLRSALPKPFYLDDKNITGTELQDKNLTHDDLLRIFDGLDEDVPIETAPVPIDLPDEKSDRREDLKIKYPFEDVAADPPEDNQESLSSASVSLKNEPRDETDPDDVDESMSVSSIDTDLKFETIEQPDEYPLLDDNTLSNDYFDSDQADDIRGILKLEQEKVELCKTIKRFSTMLKNAKIQKEKLRSQLLAYRELKMR